MPNAIIIPQKRPKNRSRGFTRAYAPDLQQFDIDQSTFLAFLDTFDLSTTESSALKTLKLASEGVGLIPSGIAAGVSLKMRVSVGVY